MGEPRNAEEVRALAIAVARRRQAAFAAPARQPPPLTPVPRARPLMACADAVVRADAQKSCTQESCARESSPAQAVVMAGPAALHDLSSSLDPALTLPRFAVGGSNQFAHAAAMASIAAPRADQAPRYNPLCIHGDVGLGKTHLLQAIAAGARACGRRVLYLTADSFIFRFMSMLRAVGAQPLRAALRGVDVFVLDDIQFLTSPKLQNELSMVFALLLEQGAQIVVAAPCAPRDLDRLDARVISRLMAGLAVEIGAPDFDLRKQILAGLLEEMQAQHKNFNVSPAVLDYVAQEIVSNGRDLQGAAIRLLARATLELSNRAGGAGGVLDVAGAQAAIADLVARREPKTIAIADIIARVAAHYSIAVRDILSSRRTAHIVRPRQVGMYLAKNLTLRSLPEIGRRFGGRDHTTVLHAVRRMEALMRSDAALADVVAMLRAGLEG